MFYYAIYSTCVSWVYTSNGLGVQGELIILPKLEISKTICSLLVINYILNIHK